MNEKEGATRLRVLIAHVKKWIHYPKLSKSGVNSWETDASCVRPWSRRVRSQIWIKVNCPKEIKKTVQLKWNEIEIEIEQNEMKQNEKNEESFEDKKQDSYYDQ